MPTHKPKLAKECAFPMLNQTDDKRGTPITSGLNASRGELHRSNFCAIFVVRFSHQQLC